MHFNINFIVFTVYLICLFTVARVYSKFALSFLYSLINSLIHYKPRGPCLSARLIFYPRSREERNKSLSFSLPPPLSFSYNAWERARRGPLAGDNRARASHPFLVLLHTHTSGWLRKWSGITERNNRRELRPPRDGREACPVLVFPLCFFFFLILPRTFIYTRLNRIDGSADRADRNIDLTR